MSGSVLNLTFSKYKKRNLIEDTESFHYKPTDVTLETGDDTSFLGKGNQENVLLPEFEALNLSIIPKQQSFASILKSSLLEEDSSTENLNCLRPFQIETNQVDSRFLCSGCVGNSCTLL